MYHKSPHFEIIEETKLFGSRTSHSRALNTSTVYAELVLVHIASEHESVQSIFLIIFNPFESPSCTLAHIRTEENKYFLVRSFYWSSL